MLQGTLFGYSVDLRSSQLEALLRACEKQKEEQTQRIKWVISLNATSCLS